ncbi:MAG: hypothetical protein EA001_01335 [Oscillatoriales cyanobacterium]|nr:MAG: hypothetical protein EA001_01335 [Oscillatoriales cyanobacterium]
MPTLVVLLLLGVYGFLGIKFWNGFRRTNFTQNRIFLTLLWPVLLINGSYRKNFQKALKG